MRKKVSAMAVIAAVGSTQLLLAGPAHAAGGVSKSGSTLVVIAAPNKSNNITVDRQGGNFVVRDSGDTVQAGSGCTQVTANRVRCSVAGVNTIQVSAGDKQDVVTNRTGTNSTLLGGAGYDTLTGGAGYDTLLGGPGYDTLRGGGGHDRLRGGGGHDRLWGGGGHDRLWGGNGHDRLRGGGGHDTLTGGRGNDNHSGQKGNDTIQAADGVRANDIANGGAGRDNCTADPGDTKTNCEG